MLRTHWLFYHFISKSGSWNNCYIDCRPVKQQLVQQYHNCSYWQLGGGSTLHKQAVGCNISFTVQFKKISNTPHPSPHKRDWNFLRSGDSVRPKNVDKCMKVTWNLWYLKVWIFSDTTHFMIGVFLLLACTTKHHDALIRCYHHMACSPCWK